MFSHSYSENCQCGVCRWFREGYPLKGQNKMNDEKLIERLREAAVDLAEQDKREAGQGEHPRGKETTLYWIAANRISALREALVEVHNVVGPDIYRNFEHVRDIARAALQRDTPDAPT